MKRCIFPVDFEIDSKIRWIEMTMQCNEKNIFFLIESISKIEPMN